MNDLNQYPLRDTAIYNPHLLSKDELIGLFAARQKLLAQLLEDLPRCEPRETPQHHLLVAQRGMGKTMLLRRLQFAIEDDPELAAVWLPLAFPEEQYNVGQLSDLWLNCLDALGDALDRLGYSEKAELLDTELEALLNLEEAQRAWKTLALLLDTAADLDRRLVLLIDNIDLILERISDQSWALRDDLSEQPAILLIGASSRALEASYKYDQPFYDFFQIHELGGLSLKETSDLLRHYAERWQNEEVLRVVREEPARIRTLHTLTGGNPRTLALLYNILGRGLDGDVRTDLENLLDLCTPLYKARLEALAPQRQRIVHALAVHWHPAPAADVAAELRLDVKAVSSQLTRLVREGVVEAVPFDPAGKTGFQLAERFFNIWYLMRATRRARRRLIWLVEFLKMFYSQEQLHSHALTRFDERRESSASSALNLARVLLERNHGLAEAEALARQALAADPHTFRCAYSLAWILARNNKWAEAFEHAETFVARATEEYQDQYWAKILSFFRKAVLADKARDAADLLDRLGFDERWKPLREALEAVAVGRRSYLKRLAPEVRQPAEEILEEFGWKEPTSASATRARRKRTRHTRTRPASRRRGP